MKEKLFKIVRVTVRGQGEELFSSFGINKDTWEPSDCEIASCINGYIDSLFEEEKYYENE